MTKKEAKKILTEYVKACREDDMLTIEQFTYEEVIEAMDIGAEAISVLPIPSNLDEAAEDFVWEVMENDEDGISDLRRKLYPQSKISDFYNALEEFFIAGAKWQKEQDEKDLSEKIAAAYQLGLADKEKQMLSEAVEGTVYGNGDYTWVAGDIPSQFKNGLTSA